MTKVSGAQVRIRSLEALLDRALKMKDYWQVRALRAEGKLPPTGVEHVHRDPHQPGRTVVHTHNRGEIPHGHHGLRYGGITRQSL